MNLLDKLRSINRIRDFRRYEELPSPSPFHVIYRDRRDKTIHTVPIIQGGSTAAKALIRIDNELRVIAAATVNGTAQAKGTATDCIAAIIVGQDGATAFAAGTTAAPVVQGAQVSAMTGAATVNPDKGALPANFVAVGLTALHFANLQFAFYRLQIVSTGAPAMDVSVVWFFFPMVDSFDLTVQ